MPALRPKQVLILEDESLLRKNLTRFLELRGHAVLAVGSIREARAVLRNETVDVAILDVALPDGSGLELLPITGTERSLVISAEVEESRLDESGVQHFLRKPLELQAVARCVAALLSTASIH